VLGRLRDFRVSKRLQIETLQYLASNYTVDAVALRNEFRALDLDNTGVLRLAEIKQAFSQHGISDEQIS